VRRFEMPAPRSNRGDTNGHEEIGLKRLTNLHVLQAASDDGHRTLVLSGELDLTSSWLLDHPLLQIRAGGTTSFTIDLSGLTFIDSAGIRSILAARGLCTSRGCEFMLIPGAGQVQRAFEVLGLIDHLPFANQRPGVATTPTPSGTTPRKQSLDRLAARRPL
jgi:anti-anti-sigma factor